MPITNYPSRSICCGLLNPGVVVLWIGILAVGLGWPISVFGQIKVPKNTRENHLMNETSPYLRAHANNPVDWYPWSAAALKKARDENKVIFLSIGYHSCHWCHVMEHESFMDEEIAKFLNDHFVCIKVDREERPDVDRIYMESLLMFNQMRSSRRGGGWPLSMFLLPDARPFFGGSYFPARDGDREGTIGFLTLITKINEIWSSKPAALEEDAKILTQATQRQLLRTDDTTQELSMDSVQEAVDNLHQVFDREFGGFGFSPEQDQIPKFPQVPKLLFLTNELSRDPKNLLVSDMVNTTCVNLRQGGIFDHIGGGWHRYSVDRYWHVPHFEKMLYDNAQLVSLFVHWYRLHPDPDTKTTIEMTIDFLNREMLNPTEGGFFSAIDADSDGHEGTFYVWTKSEIEQTVGPELWPLAIAWLGLDQAPNFEDGRYVLVASQNSTDLAKSLARDPADIEQKLSRIRGKLQNARSKRTRPALDTKVLTGENGLMIRALADAGVTFKNEAFLTQGESTAKFLLTHLVDQEGHLLRTRTGGESKVDAYLDDYCHLIDGLIALHEATQKPEWLDTALHFQKLQNDLFWDNHGGGYFFTEVSGEKLIVQIKDAADNVTPAGNNVAVGNLIYLAKHFPEQADEFRSRALKTAKAASSIVNEFPESAPRLLSNYHFVVEQKK